MYIYIYTYIYTFYNLYTHLPIQQQSVVFPYLRLDAMQDGNYRMDTSQTRPRRRLKFDSSRVVGNSIEFLSNGSLVPWRDYHDSWLAHDWMDFLCCITWWLTWQRKINSRCTMANIEVRSLRDARSFAVASQPLSSDNGSFFAGLTWYLGNMDLGWCKWWVVICHVFFNCLWWNLDPKVILVSIYI